MKKLRFEAKLKWSSLPGEQGGRVCPGQDPAEGDGGRKARGGCSGEHWALNSTHY